MRVVTLAVEARLGQLRREAPSMAPLQRAQVAARFVRGLAPHVGARLAGRYFEVAAKLTGRALGVNDFLDFVTAFGQVARREELSHVVVRREPGYRPVRSAPGILRRARARGGRTPRRARRVGRPAASASDGEPGAHYSPASASCASALKGSTS
jgi:hypothetical protein